MKDLFKILVISFVLTQTSAFANPNWLTESDAFCDSNIAQQYNQPINGATLYTMDEEVGDNDSCKNCHQQSTSYQSGTEQSCGFVQSIIDTLYNTWNTVSSWIW
ncbi:MAG: hypothetical protein ACTSXG_03475 [Alphaproteobacteria bacterium]